MRSIVDALGGIEVCDAFDMIAGTSTGAIIAFLVGLRRESSVMARKRYDKLIKMIFVKSALSTPMLLLTTATYDESPFNQVMKSILRDNSMLASRADPRVPLVFAISSKMSSTPTQLCLLRNYNYNGGEMKDAFVQDPIEAKEELGLSLEDDVYKLSGTFYYDNLHLNTETLAQGSRHPGSFRVLQRAALRATTAAPTVFKPVLMGGELYCDGGIVASNPAAIAIHEAKTIFPNVPIEMIVSCGTGAFVEEKSEPRIGWVSAFHCQYLKKDS
jgi:patatin-like phospholipase/acyl hydrolase